MRNSKANKLLLLCVQATFGRSFIVQSYSRYSKIISKVKGTGKYFN